MNCSEAKELIQLHLDEELSARDTLDVQHHFEACPSCASLLDYFARQDLTLKQFARAETFDSSPLHGRILQAISAAESLPQMSRWRVLVGNPMLRRVAAVLVIAASAAFLLLRGTTPFINENVYADAVRDHLDHCTLERLQRAVSDAKELDKLMPVYSRLTKTPDLAAFGYSEPRAKICLLNRIRVLHVIYQNPNGKPLSVFLKAHDERLVADELVTLTRNEHRLISMVEKGTDMVIVAAMDEGQAATIAKAITSQMPE